MPDLKSPRTRCNRQRRPTDDHADQQQPWDTKRGIMEEVVIRRTKMSFNIQGQPRRPRLSLTTRIGLDDQDQDQSARGYD